MTEEGLKRIAGGLRAMSVMTRARTAALPPNPSLTPRPGRPAWWVAYHSLRGTWSLFPLHVGALASFLIEVPWVVWLLFFFVMPVRGLTTTVGYHRYFAHRSFKTGRVFQFILGCLCCTNLQRGPIWWAAVHRHHHRYSDEPGDVHSPVLGGFLWGYAGWILTTVEWPDWNTVKDLRRYPELVWLDRFWLVPPLLLAAACWWAGGWSAVCVLFCLTAVIAWHAGSVVNSLGHLVGSRRYETRDRSRNSFLLACLTLGEGWHNNHHYYPHSARAGFRPGEVDLTYYVIRFLQWLGLVWGVREVPPHKLHPESPAT